MSLLAGLVVIQPGPAHAASTLQLEARFDRSFLTADLANDGYYAAALSPEYRVAVAARSRAKSGIRIGGWLELGTPIEIRGRQLGSDRGDVFRPYRFRGFGFTLSAEREHGRGTSRFEFGPVLSSYTGDQFSCPTDADHGICIAGSHGASRLGGSALLLGLSRTGLPVVPGRLGLRIDDRISWAKGEARHEVQCGVTYLLLGRP